MALQTGAEPAHCPDTSHVRWISPTIPSNPSAHEYSTI
mgnify:CR=1 FL=1